jgi:hypothetical protein
MIMKKLSLLFVLSFGLLAQAAENSEQEFARELGAVDTALEQTEGAGLAQKEDTNNAEQDSSSRTPKIKSHHRLSFLAGAASGAGFCYARIGFNPPVVINKALFGVALVAPAVAVTAIYAEKKDTVYKSKSIVGSTVLAYCGLVAGFFIAAETF